MTITIETAAYKTFLFGILSCKCPVTPETEHELFRHFSGIAHERETAFAPILAIAETNPVRTPIHNLYEFCVCAADDPDALTIGTNHVLRYLGSLFHYKMVTANHPGIEDTNPALLVSHLLVPARLDGSQQRPSAVYREDRAEIRFNNVFIPKGLALDAECFAMHMGAILCPLTQQQHEMLQRHQRLIPGFSGLSARIAAIDLTDLAPYGNHLAEMTRRFGCHGLAA